MSGAWCGWASETSGQRHGNIGSLATGQRMTTNQILSRREGAPLQGWAGGMGRGGCWATARPAAPPPLLSQNPLPPSSSPSPLGSSSSPGMLFFFFFPLSSSLSHFLPPLSYSASRQVFVSFPSPPPFFFTTVLPSLLCLYLSFGRM